MDGRRKCRKDKLMIKSLGIYEIIAIIGTILLIATFSYYTWSKSESIPLCTSEQQQERQTFIKECYLRQCWGSCENNVDRLFPCRLAKK